MDHVKISVGQKTIVNMNYYYWKENLYYIKRLKYQNSWWLIISVIKIKLMEYLIMI